MEIISRWTSYDRKGYVLVLIAPGKTVCARVGNSIDLIPNPDGSFISDENRHPVKGEIDKDTVIAFIKAEEEKR